MLLVSENDIRLDIFIHHTNILKIFFNSKIYPIIEYRKLYTNIVLIEKSNYWDENN